MSSLGTPLKNSKHERMAQLVATGSSIEKAHLGAGYRGPNLRNAHRIRSRAEVDRRIAELKNATAERSIGASLSVQEQLVQIAKVSLIDFLDEGGKYKKITDVNPSALQAVKSIELGPDGRIVRVQLVDKTNVTAQLLRSMPEQQRTVDPAAPAGPDGAPLAMWASPLAAVRRAHWAASEALSSFLRDQPRERRALAENLIELGKQYLEADAANGVVPDTSPLGRAKAAMRSLTDTLVQLEGDRDAYRHVVDHLRTAVAVLERELGAPVTSSAQ
jgi:hypothetical protein